VRPLCAVAALVCVIVVGLAAAACGTAPSADETTGFTASQYANQDFGFSIQFPDGFTKVELPRNVKDPAAPLLDVLFVDPEGTQIGGKAVDALEVAVYKLNAAPTHTDFTKNKKDFEAMLVTLIGEVPGLAIAESPAWTTVDGRPAVTETYTYSISGEQVAASAELVFKGARAYLVRAQAGRAAWQTTGRKLVSCMATFAFL
jgi:hypothetical protein